MYDVTLTTSHFLPQADLEVRDLTVGGLLREIAEDHPDAESLVEVTQDGQVGRRWTYTELLRDCTRLAAALGSRFTQGEKIVVWSPNSPEWVLLEYASALAGLVLVTANPAFKTKELRYVLEQSGAVGLFLVADFRGNPMAEIGAQAADGVAAIREIADLNDQAALYATGPNSTDLPKVAPDDPAQIQYTSGTTGFPKGAVLSHSGLVNNARFYADRCGLLQRSTWINFMPLFHTTGCAMITLGCLQAGCRMVLVSLYDPAVVVDLIESQRADFILGVPTMVVALLEEQEKSPRDVSSITLISSGGATVAPELVRRVQATFGCRFATVYGQTEHCPLVTQHHKNDSIDDICNSAGQPVAQTEVSIRSVKENATVPVGVVGEICARGPSVMIGYNDNPEATAEAIDAGGWLHSGDLGMMDARGYLSVTGRVKDMIIRGGENFFPAEIENVLLEHATVAEVAVVGLPDAKWGEIIAAFIRASDDIPLDKDGLHTFCRTEMSPQKTPVVWVQVAEFPLTGSGKIQKFKLRDSYIAGDFAKL